MRRGFFPKYMVYINKRFLASFLLKRIKCHLKIDKYSSISQPNTVYAQSFLTQAKLLNIKKN